MSNDLETAYFYSFLLACVNCEIDARRLATLPVYQQKMIAMSEWWIFSRGGEA